MADAKVTELPALTPALEDLLYAVDDPSGSPISKKLTIENLFALLGPLQMAIVVKSADESVTSSTALQDDNELTFAIGASEVWLVKYALHIDGATAGDFQCALSVPAGATYRWGHLTGASGITDNNGTASFASSTSGFTFIGTASADTFVLLEGVVTNSTTAGNVVLQWAQNTSSGTATRVFANSYLLAHRVS